MSQNEKRTEPFTASIGGTISDKGKFDTTSSTWIFIREYCHKRLQELRESNDNTQKSERETAIIRGQIKEIKNLLDLPKPKPEMYISEDII